MRLVSEVRIGKSTESWKARDTCRLREILMELISAVWIQASPLRIAYATAAVRVLRPSLPRIFAA